MTTPDKKPEQVFHSDYDDATADLVIECQDGVKLRVHSYLLMAHSEYFRKMPPHSDGAVANSAKLVHLDCASSDFASLLLVITKSAKSTSLEWSELSATIKLGQRYQFIHIPDLVHQSATRCIVSGNANAIFQFAGANGFLGLARLAIVGFADSAFDNYEFLDDVDVSFFDPVIPSFAAALMRAMAKHRAENYEDSYDMWKQISADFVL